ncbi:MAG: 30S ribosomal protein S11 [bacterium]
MAKAKDTKKGTAKKVVAKKKVVVKKKVKKSVHKARVFISASYNNTIVTISDPEGNVLCSSSSGIVGFKGSKKSTPYAAMKASEDAAIKSMKFGVKEADIFLSGPGNGKQMAIKGIKDGGITILTLNDVTPIPHNGCRPANRRKQ